jgi:tRNA (guanine10-N2)-methyltransferase
VANFGALVFGSDIDGRQMRGKRRSFILLGPNMPNVCTSEDVPGIRRAAEQYGLSKRILDLATFDVTQSPLRSIRGGLFDAIITDPPCEYAILCFVFHMACS